MQAFLNNSRMQVYSVKRLLVKKKKIITLVYMYRNDHFEEDLHAVYVHV